MQTNPTHVLLIDDDFAYCQLLKIALERGNKLGMTLSYAKDLASGLNFLEDNSADVILLDLFLPDSSGVDTFMKFSEKYPEVPVIVLTGISGETIGVTAVREGAQDYLIKGEVDHTLLTRTIQYAIERHQLKSRLKSLSITDELTGLFNRRGFESLGEQRLKVSQRLKTPLTLVYIDLDNFNLINDQYGHSIGDQVIKATAQILIKSYRKSDIIARIGGDEFAILAIDKSLKNTTIIIKRLIENLKMFNDPDLPKFTFSIGKASTKKKSTEGLSELLQIADQNLKKQRAGNGIVTL